MKSPKRWLVCALALTMFSIVPAHSARADDPPPLPGLTVGDVMVAEGDAGAAIVTVPVDLSTPSVAIVTVMYTVTKGTADSGDFNQKSGKLTFRIGITAQKVNVTIWGDTTLEGNEDVIVNLSAPVNAQIDDGQGEVVIENDDGGPPPTADAVSIGDAFITESDSGTHYVYVPLTLAVPPGADVVKVQVLNACSTTAVTTPKSQSVTFKDTQRSKTLKYRVAADTSPGEVKRAFRDIRIASGNAVVEEKRGTITIAENDGAPSDVPLGESDRINVATDGAQALYPPPLTCGPVYGSAPASTSEDGRYVVFGSQAINLVPSDTNDATDIYVRDRAAHTTERIDLADDGSELSLGSEPYSWISDDGRDVTFSTTSTEVLPTGVTEAAFVRDRVAATSELVSVLPDGTIPPFAVATGVSSDGRYVAFLASGSLYVRDRQAATTQFVAGQLSGWYWTPLTGDGQEIAFVSRDSTLVPGDTNNYPDAFVANLTTGSIERVNRTPGGQQEAGNTIANNQNAARLAMSRDGRFVAFWSASTNMGLPSGQSGVFLRDRVAGTTERVSIGYSTSWPLCFSQNEGVSNDGRYASFSVLCEDSAGDPDPNNLVGTFVRDRVAGVTTRVDELADGTEANGFSGNSVMSADGRYVVYGSQASNLVPDDTNNAPDVFIRRMS